MSDAEAPFHLAVYSDAPIFGGAEQSLGNLLEALPSRYEVSVLGTTAAVVRSIAARREGARVLVLPPASSKLALRGIAAHVAAIRRLRPDVLHANLWTPWTCQYGILAALVTPGVEVVAVEHLPLATRSRPQRWLKRQLSRRLTVHVGVGDRAGRLIEEMIGLQPGTLRTIHNGVPEPGDERPTPLGDGPVIGSLGRLAEQKGYDTLLRALAHVDGARVVIVGDGPERRRLEQLAERLGVADRFELLGWRDDARGYLAAFDVFVLPSRYEAFPLSILEAMLAGTPVLATDVGSVAEAIDHGHTGVLVAPDDPLALAAALRELLDDAQRRRELAVAAEREARERFTTPVMARAFVELYRDIAPGA